SRSVRATQTTRAPSAASSSAMVRPMPRLAPVTKAVRPVILGMASPSDSRNLTLARRAGKRAQSTHKGSCAMKYNRISADCHLDLPWMPPDLFTSMAPRELKERMPFVVDTDEGPKWTANNGATFGFKNGVGPGGAKYQKGKHHRVDVMAETGLYEDGAKDIRRVSDPHLRIKDLDRHIGLACLPYGDIDAAVTEIHRVAKMGIKGLELSCSWDMEPMWHPMWDPLWKAVNDVQLPLHFHTFPTVPPNTIEKHGGRVGRSV